MRLDLSVLTDGNVNFSRSVYVLLNENVRKSTHFIDDDVMRDWEYESPKGAARRTPSSESDTLCQFC